MGVIFKNSVMYNSSNILNYPVCYSEEEREIGCWVDGKPLYQTTIHTGALTKDGNWHSIAHNIPNIDKIILCTGTVYAADNTAYPMPNYRPTYNVGICLDATTTNIEYIQNWLDTSPDSYVTLQYTKTTDQPGSGSWTPQEIPAHHYSTNEQVVGTWINGKTLYEKTIVQTSGFSTSYSLSHGIADIDEIVKVEGLFRYTGGNYWYGINDNTPVSGYYACISDIGKSSVQVYIGGSRLSSIGSLALTIRYTKTT